MITDDIPTDNSIYLRQNSYFSYNMYLAVFDK